MLIILLLVTLPLLTSTTIITGLRVAFLSYDSLLENIFDFRLRQSYLNRSNKHHRHPDVNVKKANPLINNTNKHNHSFTNGTATGQNSKTDDLITEGMDVRSWLDVCNLVSHYHFIVDERKLSLLVS